MTDADLLALASERDIVAATLWGEARGQSSSLRHAIAAVIGNRAKASGKSLRAVCLAPKQFSSWNHNDPNYAVVVDAVRNLARGADGTILTDCRRIADALVSQALMSPVGSATHYFSPASMAPKGSVPSWARDKKSVATIDNTLFYEHIA